MRLTLFCVFVSWFLCGFTSEVLFVKGQVVNAKTREVIPYVTISFKQANASSVTNGEGKFFLRLESALADTVVFSSIGYKPKAMAVIDILKLNRASMTVALEEEAFAIKQVLISRLSARQVMEKAIEIIASEKAASERNSLEGFYRRAIKEDSQFVALTEALVHITETGNTTSDKLNVSYAKARFSNNYRKFTPDTEPDYVTAAVELDHVRYQRGFLNKHNLDFWQFEFLDFTKMNSKDVYVVYAKILDARKQPTHQAKVYIQSDDYRVLRIEYDYVWDTRNLIKEKFLADSLVQKKYAWRGTFGYRLSHGQMVLSYFHFTTNLHIYSFDAYKRLNKVAAQELHEELVISGLEKNLKETNSGNPSTGTSLLQSATPYDEQFWSTYRIPEDSQLFRQAKSDLEKRAPLKEQFKTHQ